MEAWEFRPHNNKTCIYVVRVDNYWPELCSLTIPNLKMYADKIGAEFHEITTRKYPDFPPTYEKLQVYELGMDNEWNILIDADFLLHPLCPDFTKLLRPDVVGIDSGYDASLLLNMNSKYFRRDTRRPMLSGNTLTKNSRQGIATGLVVSNNLTHDLWTPLEYGWEEARKHTKREFIVDEYCISRNIARFGLKYGGVFQGHMELRESWLVHLGIEEKNQQERQTAINHAKTLLKKWGQI